MPQQRKVFRIEAYVRAAAAHVPSRPSTPHVLQSVTRELDAVVSEAAQSIRQILAAAEAIDQTARQFVSEGHAIAAAFCEHTARIYEACTFHDIAGQRVSKVLDALEAVEDRPLVRSAERAMLHGPKVNGDSGHASQDEVDLLLGCT